MSEDTVVFAVEDQTTHAALAPVADALAGEVAVEFLFLDELFERRYEDVGIDDADRERYPSREVGTYFRHDWPIFNRFPDSVSRAALQKLVLDDLDYELAYDVSGYLADADPDVIVAGMDSLLFLRHLIREAHDREDVSTVALQHGIYPKNLSHSMLDSRYGRLSPKFDRPLGIGELCKRWLGYRYGIAVYCNPFVDEVLTFGDFFTERIGDLRADYPCFGKTDLTATGSPEYDGPVADYEPATDSVLFLSQQQYEDGSWDREGLEDVLDILRELDREAPLTVRPHPKDNQEKLDRYAEHFAVSTDKTLREDVAAHDVATTVHSTAIFEAARQGKLCGILHLPFDTRHYHPYFPPFTHEHVFTVDREGVDLDAEAATRSPATQRDYLERFCYSPELHGVADSSLELVCERIRSYL